MDLFATDRLGPATGASPAAEPGSSPPPARAPHAADLGLDDWAPRPRRPGSRRWLLVAAVVPWVVVAALLWGDAPASAPPDPSPTATAPITPTPGPTSAGGGGPLADPATPGPALQGTTATTGAVTDRGRAVGLAVTVGRSWLSTRPSGLTLDGIPPADGADGRYVEHLVVESVDHPGRGALVVTLRALVLPIDGDRYGDAAVRRLAVPVRLTSIGPQLGGPPWWLTADDPAPAPPATETVEDPDLQLAATDAVTAAGYQQVELKELGRTEGWAWVAHLQARAPDAAEVRTHTLWLRADVGRFVVAGTPAPGESVAPTPGATAGPAAPPPPTPTSQESP